MKRGTWVIASIALNFIFLALLLRLVVFRSNPSPSGDFSLTPAALAASTPVAITKILTNAGVVRAPAVGGPEWQRWLDALRAAGVSERVLSGLVSSDFEHRWQTRARDMEKQFQSGEIDSDTLMRFGQQHDVEQEREMRAALGDEGFHRWDKERILNEYDLTRLKLSETESDSLYEMRHAVDQNWRELDLKRQNGEIDDADFEEQTNARRSEYDAQMKAMLGDERYASMQNNGGENLGELRRNLKSVNASADQVDAMTQAQRNWNDQRAKLDRENQDGKFNGSDYEVQLRAIDAARDQEYQRVLGTNGFSDFQRSQDNRYRQLKRYATAWQLSESDINSLYSTIQYFENNVRDYQLRAKAAEEQGQPVDWPAVQAALKDFSRQTEDAIRDSVGTNRFQKMKRNSVFPSQEEIQ